MATIGELMEDRSPGEIQVGKPGWPSTSWFRPYYKCDGCWYGPTNILDSVRHSAQSDYWVIMEEDVC